MRTLWSHIYSRNVNIHRLWHHIPRFFYAVLRQKYIAHETLKMPGLFTFLALLMRNRKILKLFILFNHWLSIRSFGRRGQRSSCLIHAFYSNQSWAQKPSKCNSFLLPICTEQVRSPYTERVCGGGGTIYPGSRPAGVTTRSPRMVTKCLLTRSMLIKMYYHFMVCTCICSLQLLLKLVNFIHMFT